MDEVNFLKKIASEKLKNIDKAVALIWLTRANCTHDGLTARDICNFFENAGYGKQNVTIIEKNLKKDPRVVKNSRGRFIIREKRMDDVGASFVAYLKNKPIPQSESILPDDIFNNSKYYIKRVIEQINASYDYSLFDCCAVMCRRLLETLIIEVYESYSRSDEIRNIDGNFLMFSGLLNYLKKDKTINVSRNGILGLENFKKLGDLSAHNRRFNAKQNDIDRIRDSLRIASEELINLKK
ncbi:MAG: hypothetical protein PHZ04_03655 [Patescibacteria group bacterium]|nr:hypothetical protein [Patescibacteria group bacterium]MDD5294804.1 hypothetical protein [Patescibacteria group bacterium]MDD5554250.1 hypothetical protein [Patescibacteria group bacterium]